MGKSKDSNIPKTELDLQELQRLYLADRSDRKVSDEYFFLLKTYARSITLKIIKRKGIFLHPERVDEISTDAALLLMNQYRKEGWTIAKSFAGALYWKILEAMYSDAEDEQNSSIDIAMSDDPDSKRISDVIASGVCLPWSLSKNGKMPEPDDPCDIVIGSVNASYDEIRDVIDEAYRILPYNVFLKFVCYTVLYFRKPKTRNIQQLFNALFLTNKEENAFDILILEIHNRVAQHV